MGAGGISEVEDEEAGTVVVQHSVRTGMTSTAESQDATVMNVETEEAGAKELKCIR